MTKFSHLFIATILASLFAGVAKGQQKEFLAAEKIATEALKKSRHGVRADKKNRGLTVSIRPSFLTQETFLHIEKLTNLMELHCCSSAIKDKDLSHIKNLKRLRELTFRSSGITDAGLHQLKDLKEPRFLVINSDSRILSKVF